MILMKTGMGVTDGPRGGFWDADGNLYLADFLAMLFSIMLMMIRRCQKVYWSPLLMPEPF